MYHYRNLFFLLGLVLYISLFAGYISYSYTKDKEIILKNIEQELYHGAQRVPLLLPKNFHHYNMKASDYTQQEDRALSEKLSAYIKSTGLEYIHTIIMEGEKFYFTSSSATSKELEDSPKFSFYFKPYIEHEKSLRKVMQQGRLLYMDTSGFEHEEHLSEMIKSESIAHEHFFEDGTPQFRTILLPLKSHDGRTYIVAADIKLDFLSSSFTNAFDKLIFFLLPIVILMLVYFLLGLYFHMRLEKIIASRTKEIQEFNLVDTLTGLPNRKSLIKTLGEDPQVHLAILNTEGFQTVNNLYGNSVGDKLIIEMGRSLSLFIKDTSLKLYKLHADEFAVVGFKDIRQFDFLMILERVMAQLHDKLFVIDDNSISVVVSAGAASMVEVPLISATVALKEARKRNKKIYLYESHLDQASEIAHNQKVISEIHAAIKDHNIFPYFQPIYSVAEGKIVKYESLMRMKKGDGTIESPYYFLEIAHQSKLYNTLSIMMLQAVLEKAKEHPEITFSFNLSAIDIEDDVMAEQILVILKRSEVAHQLTLEILETEGFRSYKTLALFIAEVKSYGVEVAIDDFGSGYSNFAEIVELDVDYLKIDGSLVKNIIDDTHYEHIVTAIIKFAQSLNLKTIAEFVENEALAEKLMAMGVDMLQGYHIGRPQLRCVNE